MQGDRTEHEIEEVSQRPDSEALGFERLREEHLPLLHAWLHTPHVAKWWYEGLGSLDEISEEYSAYIEGREPVEPYLILCDGLPVGYIQWYRVSDDEEFARLVEVPDSAGVDILIGEKNFLYRGLGARIIQSFLREVVFANADIEACVIDPEPTNKAAIRAYEKVGFRYYKSVQTSNAPAYLMKLARSEFFA